MPRDYRDLTIEHLTETVHDSDLIITDMANVIESYRLMFNVLLDRHRKTLRDLWQTTRDKKQLRDQMDHWLETRR